jgi:membrane-associated phospholipid phosphatase
MVNYKYKGGFMLKSSNRNYFIALIGAAALILLATFADLPFEQAMYSPKSTFGAVFATLGMRPLYSLMPLCVGMLWGALIVNRQRIKAAVLVFLTVINLAASYKTLVCLTGLIHNEYGWPEIAVAVNTVLFGVLAGGLGVYFGKKNPDEVLKAALIGVIAIVGGRTILDILKEAWGRQRFLTMDNPASQFTPWYAPQKSAMSNDTYKSFPSGHTFSAMTLLWLSLFPRFIDELKPKASAWSAGLTIFAIVYTVLTMLSRIILGKHFLSDVSMSAFIFLAIFAAATAVVSGKKISSPS